MFFKYEIEINIPNSYKISMKKMYIKLDTTTRKSAAVWGLSRLGL